MENTNKKQTGLFTIDELCMLLDIEADKEEKTVKSDIQSCEKRFGMYGCTRPKGHTGFHISLKFTRPYITVMWQDNA